MLILVQKINSKQNYIVIQFVDELFSTPEQFSLFFALYFESYDEILEMERTHVSKLNHS